MPTAALAVALFLVAHGAPAVDWRRRALLLGLISAGLTLMRADAALLVALVGTSLSLFFTRTRRHSVNVAGGCPRPLLEDIEPAHTRS